MQNRIDNFKTHIYKLKNLLFISAAILVITLLFINQPFHTDDPLFIYSARSINNNIFLPYNFSFPAEDRIRFGFEGFTNPPLNSYFIALISRFFGEEPIVLHSFFIIFALFAAFSLYTLSRFFIKNTLLATCMAIATPVFMVQSHSLMPDVTVLGFWCLSVYFYIKGLDKKNRKSLLLSSLFISLALLTRYNGLLLILLLFIYSLLNRKRFNSYIGYLFIPLFVFALWCLHNWFFYGRIHILSPIAISKEFYLHSCMVIPRIILHFVYIGSTMVFPVFFALLFFWKEGSNRRKNLFITIILFVSSSWYFWRISHRTFDILFYGLITSLCLFFFIWIIKNLRGLKDNNGGFYKSSDDLFFLIWIYVIILFQSSAYFIAPKFTLLLIPPILFLLFRLLERKYIGLIAYSKIIILAIFILGLLICQGDYFQANFDSKEIPRVLNDYSKKTGKPVWFVDCDRNWGYYVPKTFSAIYGRHIFKEGDLVLGTPYFVGLLNRKLFWKPLYVLFYRTPLIKVLDEINKIFFHFDGFGSYLPYTLAFRKSPLIVIWELIPEKQSHR